MRPYDGMGAASDRNRHSERGPQPEPRNLSFEAADGLHQRNPI